MSFKDLLSKDVGNVFINAKEFAEDIDLSGLKLLGIFSEEQYEKKYMFQKDETGIVSKGATVTIKESDIPDGVEFKNGETLRVNGKKFHVKKSFRKQGLLKIELTRSET